MLQKMVLNDLGCFGIARVQLKDRCRWKDNIKMDLRDIVRAECGLDSSGSG
jgi:hypothetical protein